ncbi:argininosuccinate synthase, chloroplastic [Tanacetum coccineum]
MKIKFRLFYRIFRFRCANQIHIQRLLINKQNLHVVAPWRECDIAGREDATKYAQNHDVPVPVTKFPSSFYRFSLQFNYSSNVNRTTIVCFTSGTLSFKIGTVKESHNELMECWIFATYDLSSIPPAPRCTCILNMKQSTKQARLLANQKGLPSPAKRNLKMREVEVKLPKDMLITVNGYPLAMVSSNSSR